MISLLLQQVNALYAQTHPVQWECQALTQAAEGRRLQAMDGQPRCRDSLHSETTEIFFYFSIFFAFASLLHCCWRYEVGSFDRFYPSTFLIFLPL